MEKEIIPIADEYDKGKLLHDRKRLKELLDKLAPLGYLGATVPEEEGGYGLDYVSWGVLFEELARAFASLAGIILIIHILIIVAFPRRIFWFLLGKVLRISCGCLRR
jgi:alkylation response protein AidB-like acyl-CoA dehydrogenase